MTGQAAQRVQRVNERAFSQAYPISQSACRQQMLQVLLKQIIGSDVCEMDDLLLLSEDEVEHKAYHTKGDACSSEDGEDDSEGRIH